MSNPTPGTQLDRVLSAMRSGDWQTPEEIARLTGDPTHSITSRIRDLRLPKYGNHQVESRKRDITHQIWEYRLTSAASTSTPQTNPWTGPSIPLPSHHLPNPIWPISGDNTTSAVADSPTVRTFQVGSEPDVKFLNINTMQVERVARSRCRIDKTYGFDRVVALDSQDNILDHLVTTEDTL